MTSDPQSDDQELEALHEEVAELQDENKALRRQAERPPKHRARTISSWVLVVVACLLAVTSVLVVYTRNELLNTNTFVASLAPLAKDKAVQTAVATKVSNSLVAKTDLNQKVKDALPPRAGFLATPITSAVKTATYDITLKLVQSSRFQKLWDKAVRNSHVQLDNLLLGKQTGALSSSNGQVTIDLTQVEAAAKKELTSRGITIFNKVPTYTGAPYVLFESKQLLQLQRLVKFLNSLAVVLPILTLLLLAAAVVAAIDRRRGLVHAASGLAVTMALLLIGANVGRNQYLNSLQPSQSKAAASVLIDTVDATLVDSIRTALIVSALVALVAFIVGIGAVRRWFGDRKKPAWLTSGPVHDTVAAHRGAFQGLVVLIGLAVLVVWTLPTLKVALIVVLVTLFVVGLVGLFAGRRTAKVPAAA
ncbi:MAG: hypothetical protein WCI26_01740 [Acidimicrobiales bacterium]